MQSHPRGTGGDAISHWRIARQQDGSFLLVDSCGLVRDRTYRTFRNAWIARRARISGTTFHKARGLPS
jgi:hypothetical protein